MSICDNVVQFTMRMDIDVYERLKASAELHKRSIAKELEYLASVQLNKVETKRKILDNIMEAIRCGRASKQDIEDASRIINSTDITDF